MHTTYQSDEFYSFLEQCLQRSQPAPACGGATDRYLASLVETLRSIDHPTTLIDYGCGSGRLSFALGKLPAHQLRLINYFGVDSKQDNLRQAEKSARENGLANSQVLTSEEFWHQLSSEVLTADVLICVNVLHEIPVSLIGPLLSALCYRISPGGMLFLQDMGDLPVGEQDFVCFTATEIAKIMQIPSLSTVQLSESVSRRANVPVWAAQFRLIDSFNSLDAMSILALTDFVLDRKRAALNEAQYSLKGQEGARQLASLLYQNKGLLAQLASYYRDREAEWLRLFPSAPLYCPICLRPGVYVGSRYDIECEHSIYWMWCSERKCPFAFPEDEKDKVWRLIDKICHREA